MTESKQDTGGLAKNKTLLDEYTFRLFLEARSHSSMTGAGWTCKSPLHYPVWDEAEGIRLAYNTAAAMIAEKARLES